MAVGCGFWPARSSIPEKWLHDGGALQPHHSIDQLLNLESREKTIDDIGSPERIARVVGGHFRTYPAHMDFIPTFCAAGGDPYVVAKCLNGFQVGNKTFKVHLDGYNLMPFFKGEVKESPRKGFLYWSDDGDIFALRVGRWKTVFIEQNHEGLDIWRRSFDKLRLPKLFDLLADPFERGDS